MTGKVHDLLANEVLISGVHQHRNLIEDTRNQTVEWLHPIASEEEIPVDVHVARIVGRHFSAERLHNASLIQIVADVAKFVVAEGIVTALPANVVGVQACPLERSDQVVVA